MNTIIKRNHFILALALFGMLFIKLPVFAMDPDSMKMEGNKGEMMQNEQMSADEMIKKGNEMIMRGKEMKKKGMMMKKKEMKKDKMMKGNEMKEDKMDGMGTKEMNK